MKILFISSFFHPHKGGIELYAEELLTHIMSYDSDITADILTYNTNNSIEHETYKGIAITRIPCFPLVPGQFYLAHLLPLISTLWNLRTNNYDIVMTQTRFFDTTWWTWIYGKMIGAKTLFIGHGTDYVSHSNPIVKVTSILIDQTIARFSVKQYDRRIVISLATQKFFKEKLGVSDTLLVHGGIDSKKFDVRRATDHDKNTVTISFVGRLIQAKGIHELVDAVAEIASKYPQRKIVLNLAGTGPELSKLEQHISALVTNASINVLGNLSYEKVQHLLAATDIFINPSYNEGLPRVVIEAAAAGCIVIATDVGSTYEIMSEFGHKIPPRNSHAITDAIRKILMNLEQEKIRAQHHKQFVQQTFDWNIVAQQFTKELHLLSD